MPPVLETLGTAGEVDPPIPCRGIAIWGVTSLSSIGCRVGKLHSSGSHPTYASEHLGNLITTMDGLATASTSHLVVRLSADTTLAHVSDLVDCVSTERHVSDLNLLPIDEYVLYAYKTRINPINFF